MAVLDALCLTNNDEVALCWPSNTVMLLGIMYGLGWDAAWLDLESCMASC